MYAPVVRQINTDHHGAFKTLEKRHQNDEQKRKKKEGKAVSGWWRVLSNRLPSNGGDHRMSIIGAAAPDPAGPPPRRSQRRATPGWTTATPSLHRPRPCFVETCFEPCAAHAIVGMLYYTWCKTCFQPSLQSRVSGLRRAPAHIAPAALVLLLILAPSTPHPSNQPTHCLPPPPPHQWESGALLTGPAGDDVRRPSGQRERVLPAAGERRAKRQLYRKQVRTPRSIQLCG